MKIISILFAAGLSLIASARLHASRNYEHKKLKDVVAANKAKTKFDAAYANAVDAVLKGNTATGYGCENGIKLDDADAFKAIQDFAGTDGTAAHALKDFAKGGKHCADKKAGGH